MFVDIVQLTCIEFQEFYIEKEILFSSILIMSKTWKGGLGYSFWMGDDGQVVDTKKRSMDQLAKHQSLKIKMLLNTRLTSMANMSLYLPKRLLQYRSVHCKSQNIDCLIKELCIDDSRDNPTYTSTKEEIPDNHGSVWCSFGISTKNDLPSLYWVPMLYKCP
jgi:hypothetical protein